MKFFGAVFLIAVTTAVVGSNISFSSQIAAAKTFFREVTPSLQIAVERLRGDSHETAMTDVSAEGGVSKLPATTPGAFDVRPAISEPGGGAEEPVKPAYVETAAKFASSTEQASEVPAVQTVRASSRPPAPPRALPLTPDEVSEVIQRLGRLSRAVARNSGGATR